MRTLHIIVILFLLTSSKAQCMFNIGETVTLSSIAADISLMLRSTRDHLRTARDALSTMRRTYGFVRDVAKGDIHFVDYLAGYGTADALISMKDSFKGIVKGRNDIDSIFDNSGELLDNSIFVTDRVADRLLRVQEAMEKIRIHMAEDRTGMATAEMMDLLVGLNVSSNDLLAHMFGYDRAKEIQARELARERIHTMCKALNMTEKEYFFAYGVNW